MLPILAYAERDFQLRKQITLKGDIAVIGNTQMSCSPADNGAASSNTTSTGGYDAGQDGIAGGGHDDDATVNNGAAIPVGTCTATLAGIQPGGSVRQNNLFNYMHFLNVDTGAVAATGATITNSSTANLALTATSTVKAAYLYWGASLSAGDATTKGRPRDQVLFKTPANASYQQVTATTVDEATITALNAPNSTPNPTTSTTLCDGGDGYGVGAVDNGTLGTYPVYQSVADVTSLVAAGGSGTYGVANLAGLDVRDSETAVKTRNTLHSNCYAGWALVVIYEDTTNVTDFRSLNVFDGLLLLLSNQTKSTTLSGFQTPATGTFNVITGSLVYEGDANITGDSMKVVTNALTTELGNDDNKTTAGGGPNIFNGSNTRQTLGQAATSTTSYTTRNPSDANMLGFDIDTINVPTASTVFGNGTTSFDLEFATTGDVISPAMFFINLPTEVADLVLAKAVSPATVALGETVTFTITVSNNGTRTATGVVMRDPQDDGDSLTQLANPHSVLPAGFLLNEVTTSQGTCTVKDSTGTTLHTAQASHTGLTTNNENTMVDCALGSIAAGGSVTITMKGTVNNTFLNGGQSRAYTNVASAQANQGVPLQASGQTAAVTGENVLVAGRVWNDTNHDRVLDDTETVRDGWTVRILDPNTGAVLGTKVTDSDGRYSFRETDISGFVSGTQYRIQFLSPTGSTLSKAVSGSNAGNTTTNVGSILLPLPSNGNIIEQNLPLDPSGIVYNALTGTPVAGATVTMSGPPGFDANAHLAPGQQGQVTGTDGFYRFDINQFAGAPAGIYTIAVTPPNGYTFVSTLIPPSGTLDVPSALVVDPFLVVTNASPNINGTTTYYLSFLFDGNDTNVVQNHIPLDPLATASTPILIAKTTPKETVVKGELVPYTITAYNVDTTVYNTMAIVDTVPPGFKYVSGSATLDGVASEPVIDGRTLTWSPVNFALSESHTITMMLVVGSGVDLGKYVNSVQVNDATGSRVSNIATATVLLVADAVMDCSDIIGTVFDDANGNAYQDEGERGLPGVRVVTVNGLLITTDQYGRYHVACADIPQIDRGSNFILKVDERTLPTGFRMTSENPRVVRTTRGKLVKANFAASLMKIVRVQLDSRAFQDNSPELLPRWVEQGLPTVVERLLEQGQLGLLRLVYWGNGEDADLVDDRVDWVADQMEKLWGEEEGRPPLTIEREIRAQDPAEEAQQ
ncbi:MAG: DUF11 domain-containing protein [Gammaproteobacteria bacterium]|nr:DUF11 domain-containing protein [Gammaproteobacteria bacterium]